jgi:hypothetical protein
MLLMPLTFVNRKDQLRGAETSLSLETIVNLQTQATGAIPTPGETLISKVKVTMQTGTNKSVCSARYLIITRRNAASESTPTNHALTPMDAHSGQRSMLPRTTTKVKNHQHQSRLSRIFSIELDGTPTSSSSRHSADHFEFVCHLYCNLY